MTPNLARFAPLIVLFHLAVSADSAAAAADTTPPRFLFMGDWGGGNDEEPTTDAQIATASGFKAAVDALQAERIYLLGDNFYTYGINTTDGLNSTRFNDTFEAVYTREMFGDLPFHVIAGNHDWRGTVDAQIEYSAIDSRWNFVGYAYTPTPECKLSILTRRLLRSPNSRPTTTATISPGRRATGRARRAPPSCCSWTRCCSAGSRMCRIQRRGSGGRCRARSSMGRAGNARKNSLPHSGAGSRSA